MSNGTMIDMSLKFHANNLTCLKGCCDQLCQVLKADQAAIIKIYVICQNPKGYHLQFFYTMSSYHCKAGMRCDRRKEGSYDLGKLHSAG